jgi:hypothetical protein
MHACICISVYVSYFPRHSLVARSLTVSALGPLVKSTVYTSALQQARAMKIASATEGKAKKKIVKGQAPECAIPLKPEVGEVLSELEQLEATAVSKVQERIEAKVSTRH